MLLRKSRPGDNRSRSSSFKKTSQSPTWDSRLFLKINANRAADLVQPSQFLNDESNTQPALTSKKSINPVLVALLNKTKKKTSRKLNTNQPTWDDIITIELKPNDYSQVLTLSIWDKHKSSKVYLGELRLFVKDIFLRDGVFKSSTELRWHKLYSTKSHHSFVTGSLLVSFELLIKKKKTKKSTRQKNLDIVEQEELPSSGFNSDSARVDSDLANNNVIVNVVPPSRNPTGAGELNDKVDNLAISDTEVEIKDANQALLQSWFDSLLYPDPSVSIIQLDDQGFYADEGEIFPDPAVGISDIESMDEVSVYGRSRSGSNASSLVKTDNATNINLQGQTMNNFMEDSTHNSSLQFLSVTPPGEEDVASSDVSYFSTDSAFNSDFISDRENIFSENHSVKSKSKKRFGRKRKLKALEKFEVKNRKVLGVLFLEIVSCTDLPPLKNMTRTSFDMDPFVVVTFGKKTFRTSWKRHTLNPIFNERLAFEVMSHERNFDVQFSILDKDHFSFHDNVANLSLSMNDLRSLSTQVPEQKSEEEKEDLEVFSNVTPSGVSTPPTTTSQSLPAPNSLDDEILKKGIKILEDDNMVESIRKKKFMKRKKVTLLYADTSNFKTMNLSLKLHDSKLNEKYKPILKVRSRFQPYDELRRQFWKILLDQYNFNETPGQYDYIELISVLDTFGCENSDDIVAKFFQKYGRSTWGGDVLKDEEIIDCLEEHVLSKTKPEDKIFEIEKCPLCYQKKLSKKLDIDIITHVAICASKDWSIVNKLLVSSYVTPQAATKRWFSKVLIKLTYGKYQIGSNSANILVQDRTTGIIMEEKMGVYVRLGIRLLYKGLDKAKTRRVRQLLRKLSVKQGTKFDHPSSKNDIESFIKFHKLDLTQCLIEDPQKYNTFNEFFYRRLKPGARPNESPKDCRIVVSPADCRCTAFETVDLATELWIKGRNFSLAKLFNGNFSNLQDTDLFKPEKSTLGIFRLAPQDYHRFHCPVDGKIRSIKYIEGEYYTVNPMAIRSDLDVFGENVRVLISIDTKEFGTVIMIAVGAMMVGSTILSVKEGDFVKRGEEVGYFKFGGSTIVLLFEKLKFQFDVDLLDNSKTCIETLIRVGQSIGHAPEVDEFKRDHIDFGKQSKEFKLKLIRVLTGGDLNDPNELSNWESSNIKISNEDIKKLIKTTEDPGYVEDEEENDFDSEDDEILLDSRDH